MKDRIGGAMHIIYHCYGGAHSSVTAASIHLGFIAEEGIPGNEELMTLPYYDQPTKKDHGLLRFLGIDKAGNRVYIIGRRNLRKCFPQLFQSLAGLLNVSAEELIIIDTVPYVNLLMMLGGFTSRRLGWVDLGRPLVLRGTKKAFPDFVKLVRKTKLKCEGNIFEK